MDEVAAPVGLDEIIFNNYFLLKEQLEALCVKTKLWQGDTGIALPNQVDVFY